MLLNYSTAKFRWLILKRKYIGSIIWKRIAQEMLRFNVIILKPVKRDWLLNIKSLAHSGAAKPPPFWPFLTYFAIFYRITFRHAPFLFSPL